MVDLELFKRQLTTFTYTPPPAPFSYWTSLFANVRIMSRMGRLFPIESLRGNFMGNIMSLLQPVGTYYLPVGIVLAVMLVGALLMTISCCCMCCCQCCCKSYLRKKYQKKTPPSKLKKGFAWCLYFLPIVIVGLSIAAHLGGVNHFTVGSLTMQSGITGILDNSKSLIDSAVPTLNTVVDNLKVGVNSAIDLAVDSVSLVSLDTDVLPPLNAMCDDLIVAQSGVDAIKAASTQITANVDTLRSTSETLITKTENVNSGLQNLTQVKVVTTNPAISWSLNASFVPPFTPVDASAVRASLNSAPDTATIFSGLTSTPNLTAFAVEGRNAITTAKTQATSLINTSRTNLKTSVGTSLDQLKTGLGSSLTPMQSQIGGTLTGLKADLNTQFGMLNQYDDYRIYGQMGLVLLYVLPIMFMNLGGLSRRPGCMKCCNLVCVPYYLLLYVFGIIFLLLTAILGDVCTLAFDTRPTPLMQFDPMIGAAVNAIDSCYAGSSLLQVAGSLNLGINASQLDMGALARAEIDKFNISSMSNFNLGSVVSLSSSPATQVASISNISLAGMNVGPLNDISVTTVPNLMSQYATLLGVVQDLRANIVASNMVITPPGSSNPATQAQALADFQALMDTYINTITGIRTANTGDLALISNSSTTLSTTIVSVNATANSLIANVTTLPAKYTLATNALTNFTTQAQNNITLAVPLVRNSMLTTIDAQQAFVDRSFACKPIANEFMKVRQGLCGDLLASFESWWSSLVIMSLYSFLSLPIIVFVANTLFMDLTQYQDQTDPEFGDYDVGVVEGKGKNIQIGVPAPNILTTEQYESPIANSPAPVYAEVYDNGVYENGVPVIITSGGSIPANTNISEAMIRNPSMHSHRSGVKTPMLVELEQSLQRRSMMLQQQPSDIYVQFGTPTHSRQATDNSMLMAQQPGLSRQASQRSQKRTSILATHPSQFDVPIVEQSQDFVDDYPANAMQIDMEPPEDNVQIEFDEEPGQGYDDQNN